MEDGVRGQNRKPWASPWWGTETGLTDLSRLSPDDPGRKRSFKEPVK
jgi:hypothetical protein